MKVHHRTAYITHDAARHISQQTLADMAAAHGCDLRNGGASCDDSRADLLAWLSEGEESE